MRISGSLLSRSRATRVITRTLGINSRPHGTPPNIRHCRSAQKLASRDDFEGRITAIMWTHSKASEYLPRKNVVDAVVFHP